tara:strand:+ start:1958 stop:2536 length:579 start_codon:yes stop_codon:yes gene_type:complete
LNKKLNIFFLVIFFFLVLVSNTQANLQEDIFKKFESTKTLSFDFIQKIENKKEIGNCFIKYPLLMKCNYDNLKKKIIISNGKTVAVIKKKYKKIYYYPLKSTPLFIILKKEKILKLIKENKPTEITSEIVTFEFIDKKSNKLKILFDKKTLDFKGWKTKDSYANNVSFIISNLKINNQIIDAFFKIPREEDL